MTQIPKELHDAAYETYLQHGYKAAAEALEGGVPQHSDNKIFNPHTGKEITNREEFLEIYPGYREFFETLDREDAWDDFAARMRTWSKKKE